MKPYCTACSSGLALSHHAKTVQKSLKRVSLARTCMLALVWAKVCWDRAIVVVPLQLAFLHERFYVIMSRCTRNASHLRGAGFGESCALSCFPPCNHITPSATQWWSLVPSFAWGTRLNVETDTHKCNTIVYRETTRLSAPTPWQFQRHGGCRVMKVKLELTLIHPCTMPKDATTINLKDPTKPTDATLEDYFFLGASRLCEEMRLATCSLQAVYKTKWWVVTLRIFDTIMGSIRQRYFWQFYARLSLSHQTTHAYIHATTGLQWTISSRKKTTSRAQVTKLISEVDSMLASHTEEKAA